jgi:hypothetical protein
MSSAENKNAWNFTSTHPYVFISWCLVMQWIHVTKTWYFDKHRDKFTFTLRKVLDATVSRTSLGPTQPPIQGVPGALFLGVKRPGSEADHSPPSSAEVKNAYSYTSPPPIRLYDVVLS